MTQYDVESRRQKRQRGNSIESRNDVDYDYLFKILLIGDSGIGKTSILQRFAQGYFSNEYVATIGVDFHIRTLDIDSKSCKIQVWDTAGQDRFKCVVASFYRNANGVMLCFDLTDLESFRNINTWYEEIKRYCPENTPVFLIGTKSDLKTRRTVSAEMIKAFTEKNQLTYLETSAKTSDNVENSFIDFTRKLVEYTNQVEFTHKTNRTDRSNIDLNMKHKPVQYEEPSGGCFGGNKCTI